MLAGLRLLATLAPLICATLLCAPAFAQGGAPALTTPVENARSDPTEIRWDTWGVPHIHSGDPESLFFAFGWAQMHGHADLILRLYGDARGRAAEYWGEAHLDSDRYVHTMDVPARARSWYALQTAEMKAYLDAFVAGMNAYADAHPDRIADAMQPVLPVAATVVLAHVQRVIHLTFIAGNAPWMREQWKEGRLGSNAWAVGPSRSASGHALLIANPHMPWGDLSTMFEAQLVARHRNDAAPLGQGPMAKGLKERGHELAPGQIAGSAKQDEVKTHGVSVSVVVVVCTQSCKGPCAGSKL